jgi:hypothetical protein
LAAAAAVLVVVVVVMIIIIIIITTITTTYSPQFESRLLEVPFRPSRCAVVKVLFIFGAEFC